MWAIGQVVLPIAAAAPSGSARCERVGLGDEELGLTTEPETGCVLGPMRKQMIVQRKRRSHGVGNPRVGCVAGRKVDARTQTEAAPDGKTDMRCRPAYQRLPTDVSGSDSPSARSVRANADRTGGRLMIICAFSA